MFLDGKVALVTGGAQGIGLAVVKQLLQNGACVAICDVNDSLGEKEAKELSAQYPEKVIYCTCDVTDERVFEESFKRTKQLFGGLDIVVNNAGIGVNWKEGNWTKTVDVNLEVSSSKQYFEDIYSMPEIDGIDGDISEQKMDTNKGTIRGSILGMKFMGKDSGGRGGTVVNIGSISAFSPLAALTVYSATKAAVNQFTRSFGTEFHYKRTGVKLLCLNPGYTSTELIRRPGTLTDDPEVAAELSEYKRSNPIQSPEAVGRAVVEIIKKGDNGSLWTVDADELRPSVMA